MTSPIDLSRLPRPDIIETIDVEGIVEELKSAMLTFLPDLADVLNLESEPAVKLLEFVAFREILLRARINDAASSVMLASATGADLENLAALLGVSRKTILAADLEATPPVPAEMEADAELRTRAQLAIEGLSTAGTRESYRFHALSAAPEVKDVSVTSPSPGTVVVTVLSHEAGGVPSASVLFAVETRLNDDRIRPLTDSVQILPATILNYSISAALTVFSGADPSVVRAAAETALRAYVVAAERLGVAIRRSAIFAALHQSGVEKVALALPAADIEPGQSQVAICGLITLTGET